MPILEYWSWDVEENGGFCEKHGGFERGSIREDNEHSQKFEGKLKTNFKKTILKMQNTHFSWLD